MKKGIVAAASAVTLAALVPLTVTQVQAASAGAAGLKGQQRQPGAITIESWLYVVPSENVLSATVWDCFKVTGAITDEGGGPTWTNDTSYAAPNSLTSGGATAASGECADKVPAGGFIAVPPQKRASTHLPSTPPLPARLAASPPFTPSTRSPGYEVTSTSPSPAPITSRQRHPGQGGRRVDRDVEPFTTGPDCTWLITGGTGPTQACRVTARALPMRRTLSPGSTTPSTAKFGGPGGRDKPGDPARDGSHRLVSATGSAQACKAHNIAGPGLALPATAPPGSGGRLALRSSHASRILGRPATPTSRPPPFLAAPGPRCS